MEGYKAAATAIDDGEVGGGGKEAPLGLKLRRVISTSKRGGLCTPAPSWKLEQPRLEGPDKGEQHRLSVSARKLGAGLWEIQALLPMSTASRPDARIRHQRRGGKALEDGHDRSTVLDHKDWPQGVGLRRHIETSLNRHHNLTEISIESLQPLSPAISTSSLEISPFDREITGSTAVYHKGKLGDARYSLKTSTELTKVLNRIWSLEEQHESNVALVKALKLELEHAQARIQELMNEQHAYHNEMDHLTKQVTEDNIVRKKKEQQKIKAAMLSIRQELEDERQLRRRSESLHRKLGKELFEAKTTILKVAKDLERARKTNGLLEDLCDAFARGIKDYEREVRLLKQKSGEVCDHKVDRLVLHLSEAWLDEREQMKIAEAQGDMVNRTMVADKLQSEIEAFIQASRSNLFNNGNIFEKDGKREFNLQRQSLESLHLNGAASAPQDVEDDDDGSVASDLHCFELNMGSGSSVIVDHNLQQNSKNAAEKLDSARNSTCFEEKVVFSKKRENHHIPSFVDTKSQEEWVDAKLCGSQKQLLNREPGKRPQNNAESEPTEANQDENSKPQVYGYMNAHEGSRGVKMMQDHRHTSDHPIANPVKNFSEVSECCKDDRDKSHGSELRDHCLSGGPFGLVGSATVSGDFQSSRADLDCIDHHKSLDFGMYRSSSKYSSLNENNLKTRLLEARLEGQQARLKATRGSSVGRIGNEKS